MVESEMKEYIDKIYKFAREKKDISEEDLRTYFVKTDILKHLGYKGIGEDVNLERTIKKGGKRTDIQCIDDYGNVIFVIEFKKPSDKSDLKSHFNQLWERYVLPLKAKYGILTNGLRIIFYERIGTNPNVILDKNLGEITEENCEELYKLKKPHYELTLIEEIMSYFNKFSDQNERRALNTELARELFYKDFMLEEKTAFSGVVQGIIQLFDYQYGKSKFLTSAYDFWLKSYAKKPDKIPKAWVNLLKDFGLSNSRDDLNKFMFCLETSYALFTRLILAKACEDYNFPHIDFSEFMNTIRAYSRRGDIPLTAWGMLITKWIENLRESLVESIFEEDIFYWWTDRFNEIKNESIDYLFSSKVDKELVLFSRSLADIIFTLYKYDFSQIAGDPLGDLYQKYFDRETRKALGEFYTPKEVVKYILDAVGYKGQFITDKRLLDPACGSGTFLVEALRKYLDASKSIAEKDGWGKVLKKLCNEFHIVGFDIHPFATIMAQIHFMLVLIPYYKKAIEEDKTFVLRRIPIFRTDSLIDERKGERNNLFSFDEGSRDVQLNIPLPVRKKIEDKEFIEMNVTMPRSQEVWKKTDLRDIPQYFCALQAIFDVVKYLARNEKYEIDKGLFEKRLKEYLNDKDWEGLVSFFTPYANKILETIKDLKYKFGDGRLVKSVEDIMLAGLLKNYVKYDYVVGNPPYVRIQNIPISQRAQWAGYITASGNFDIYLLFIERGIQWLREEGRLGYINPNRFATVNYGKELRRYISENTTILQYLDFRDTGVFRDVLNYPVIIILEKRESRDHIINCCRMIYKPPDIADEQVLEHIGEHLLVADSSSYYYGKYFDIFGFPSNKLDIDGWYIMPPQELRIYEKIMKKSDSCFPLIKLTEGKKEDSALFEGSSTGAKKIFILKLLSYQGRNKMLLYSLEDKKEWKIEKEILKPYVEDSGKWIPMHRDEYILFPYIKDEEGIYTIIQEETLKEKYPSAWEYLFTHKQKLLERADTKKYEWYKYSAARSLELYEQRKLMVQGFSKRSSVSIDNEGKFFFGPDIYGLALREEFRNYYPLILGILNSDITNFFVCHIGVIHGSGYYKFEDRFTKKLPIKLPKNLEEKKIVKEITDKVNTILSQAKIEQRMHNFPHSFMDKMEGIELDEIIYTFKANHKSLEPEMIELVDGGYGVILGTKEDAINVETKERAKYIIMATKNKKVRKDEKLKILIPKDEKRVKELLREYEKDKKKLEEMPVSKLEEEINELVYELYGLDSKKDREVIESFLQKF